MPKDARRVRMLVTPEGVPLPLEIADAGQRAGAFVLDMLILLGSIIAITVFLAFVAKSLPGRAVDRGVGLIWTIGLFLLRNFYFTWFEARPRGQTPGKRALGIRVIARHGGRLTLDAVIARNALREVEAFLPIMLMFASFATHGYDTLILVFALGWTAIFLFMPLMNRDRLRAGDLLAGTWVIRVPKRPLLPELSADAEETVFTEAELDAYGVFELETLEQVIRQAHAPAVATVTYTICQRIGRQHWSDDGGARDLAFLQAYYAALRGRLEQKLLFGKRRADKHDRS
ncbi:RDD family protein [Sphingomonas sp. CGMCC 1.13654]|uniref:RDD family protein n=2 Tax=Sphingomonas chungangi TaxID=2683589 RepID=A0A838L3D7_9SPHN|nr:RDD family protein [Sphingomonas chungangi]MVW57857.1 RDD family protein [Sphingomonas chungangi]